MLEFENDILKAIKKLTGQDITKLGAIQRIDLSTSVDLPPKITINGTLLDRVINPMSEIKKNKKVI